MFGWILALGGLVPLWFARRAIQTGDVRVGDKVQQTRYSRADAPAAFWAGVGFYVFLGVGLIVLGGLFALGILSNTS
jgi:hypothetical protein